MRQRLQHLVMPGTKALQLGKYVLYISPASELMVVVERQYMCISAQQAQALLDYLLHYERYFMRRGSYETH